MANGSGASSAGGMKRFLPLAALPFLVAAGAPPGDVAYDLVEGMTTEVGPRLAGTEQEARAREVRPDWSARPPSGLRRVAR